MLKIINAIILSITILFSTVLLCNNIKALKTEPVEKFEYLVLIEIDNRDHSFINVIDSTYDYGDYYSEYMDINGNVTDDKLTYIKLK